MLLVNMEIIATTYHLTIIKTNVFSLNSHLCMYIATHLDMVCLDCLQAVVESAIGRAPENDDRVNTEIHSQIVIEQVSRCTWRPWSCEPGGHNQVGLEIHLEAVIERVWRYAHGGNDDANMEAVIVQVRRHTYRLWSCKLGDRNCASFDEYLAAVNGQCAGCWDWIHLLFNSPPWECDKVTSSFSSHAELADGSRSCRKLCRKLKLHSGVKS